MTGHTRKTSQSRAKGDRDQPVLQNGRGERADDHKRHRPGFSMPGQITMSAKLGEHRISEVAAKCVLEG